MKFTIPQEKLKEGLGVVEKISAKSLTLPILNNVLISTDGNFLNLTTTDLEVGIKWWGLAKIEKQGQLAVPVRLFSGFVSLLPNKKIDIEVKDNNLFVLCGEYKTQIRGQQADDFPLLPKIEKDEFVLVDNKLFSQGVEKITNIPVISTTRPEISGVYFSFQKNLIISAATDSFRLAEKKIKITSDFNSKQKLTFILPQKTTKEIIDVFGQKDGESRIYFSPHHIVFESFMKEAQHPEVQLVSKLIEGEYPNYQDIIPKKFTSEANLIKEDFINQIKSASLFSGKINEVKIKTDPQNNKILISSKSPGIGDYESEIPAKLKGESIEASFNYRFLMDGILNIKSSELSLQLNEDASGQTKDAGPAIVKPIGDDSYLYVVMPIRNS